MQDASWTDLPLHLALRVLQHLGMQDRLQARRVCKAFSTLTEHDEMLFDVANCSSLPQKLKSFVRFCSTQAKAAKRGAVIHITNPYQHHQSADPPAGLLQPFLSSALSCANLQQLECAVSLRQSEAETLLQTAPEGLQSLFICADLEVLTAGTWRRLHALSRLHFRQLESADMGIQHVHAKGLPLLRNLLTLDLTCKHKFADHKQIIMDDLILHKLESLHYNWDTFAEPVFQGFCPALQCLRITGRKDLLPLAMPWLGGRCIHTLGCAGWEVIFNLMRPVDILCQTIELFAPFESDASEEEVDPIPIWCLQQLPNLRCLRVVKSVSASAHGMNIFDVFPTVIIEGNMPEIYWLQGNLKCEFEEGIDVQLRCTAGPRNWVVSIQSNGHSVLCACEGCCT